MSFLPRLAVTLAAAVCLQAQPATPPALDTAAIESATGLKGTFDKAENVFKVSKPRDDIKVSVDRWTMSPFMGLTSYAAFTPAGGQTMMMGDTVLVEDEVNPAISAALDAGLQVTALHNHFFFDQPRLFFMHIGGMGDAGKLASGVKSIYDRVAQIRAAHPTPAAGFMGDIPASSSISPRPIEQILGKKADVKDGMAKVTIGLSTKLHGATMGNQMGVNTWAAFAGDNDHAVVDGDFAMHENELQPVLRAMRAHDINIVAIHQHMADESPRILFLHYWGKGRASDLASGVKAALDAQRTAK
jgi:hypothetical protein